MVTIRFSGDEPGTIDRSGLTGDPDIPDPPRENGPFPLPSEVACYGGAARKG